MYNTNINVDPDILPEHSGYEIQVDLIVEKINEINFTGSGGLRTTHYLQNIMAYYPTLHPLTIMVKMFLKMKRLGSAYTGNFFFKIRI